MKGVMIQGTSSDVGKSLIATAFCRLFVNEGIRVAPFKSQNMSNNSYVTIDGKEIGRAQGIQAEAAKTEATVLMNPILLKPRSDSQSEVVLLGKAIQTLSGKGYRESFYEKGVEVIQTSLEKLAEDYEVVVMEGAGSPVEINLKDRELVNMKVAEIADIPVILVADIDRGGVFASIVGTLELFTKEERDRVKGIIVNKFRGDFQLFEDGVKWIEEKTGIPVLAVLPYIEHHGIDGEDSLSLDKHKNMRKAAGLDIAIIDLPFISNYSDIEPFYREEDVSIRLVKHAEEFGSPDGVIIPGTKSTIRDLQVLKEKGIDEKIIDYVQNGGSIVGICGGYQMLGERLIDPDGTDTGISSAEENGLGLIPAKTIFQKDKKTVRAYGICHPQTGLDLPMSGYEIHLGETIYTSNKAPFLVLDHDKQDGFYSENGRVIGTYLHHLFHNDEWRCSWLNERRKAKGLPQKESMSYKGDRYDQLAEEVAKSLDWEKVKKIVFEWKK